MNKNTLLPRGASIAALLTISAVLQAATPAQDQKFVTRLYQDLLNRAPTQNEAILYSFVLGFGATRTQVAGAVTSSLEYRSDQIRLYFSEFLNRKPTPGEVSFFLSFIQNGATDDQLKAAILGSDEFYRLAGGTDAGFLNRLFEDVLGRPVDRLAAATLEAMLGKGTPRQAIAGLILGSLEADEREVTQFFQNLLHRPPQSVELANYVQILQLGGKDELVIDLICGSDEYFNLAQL